MNERYLAAFDLDQTLFKVNCSFAFGKYLYSKKFFSRLDMLYVVFYYGLHKCHFFSLIDVHKKIFKRIFLGKSRAAVKELSECFLQINFEKMLYLPAIEKLREAIRNGQIIAIFSSSPQFLVEPVAAILGVHRWEASIYAADVKGNFSHISTLVQGNEKAQCMEKLAQHEGISLDKTIAYSDSYLDLPFLEKAAKAVGVNPDRRLRALCRARGWEII